MSIYLVTGGAGFIGSSMVEALLDRGHVVRVVDNLTSGRRENLQRLSGPLDVAEMDINETESLTKVMRGVEVVIHLAALASVQASMRDPLRTHHVNATGTLSVLIAARDAKARRVIYAGSSAGYGDADIATEALPPKPLSPYGAAKLCGEMYCTAFATAYALETVILRYFNIFGPRQDPASEYAAVVPRFITALLRGEPPTIYGDGQQTRDFTHIENVVYANLLAAVADPARVSGETFNIATGTPLTLLALASAIGAALDHPIQPHFEPARVGDIRHSQANIDKAGERLGYEPVIDFADGLRRTLDWYKENAVL